MLGGTRACPAVGGVETVAVKAPMIALVISADVMAGPVVHTMGGEVRYVALRLERPPDRQDVSMTSGTDIDSATARPADRGAPGARLRR